MMIRDELDVTRLVDYETAAILCKHGLGVFEFDAMPTYDTRGRFLAYKPHKVTQRSLIAYTNQLNGVRELKSLGVSRITLAVAHHIFSPRGASGRGRNDAQQAYALHEAAG